jgi:uroporphyrinogen-III synthase
MIDDLGQGKIDAIAFTSQPQVPNLLTIASHAGKEESLRENLNGPVVVASVGPVCSRRLHEVGIKVDVEPEHPHMGNLVLAVAEYFQERQVA